MLYYVILLYSSISNHLVSHLAKRDKFITLVSYNIYKKILFFYFKIDTKNIENCILFTLK